MMRATFILLLFCGSTMALDRPIDNAWIKPPPQSATKTKQTWRSNLDTNDLLKAPKQLSFGVDLMKDSNGNPQLKPYQKLALTAEKNVSLSFDQHKPKIKLNTGSFNTALKLRRNGLKMEFNPTDKHVPLQIALKVTDHDSELSFDYHF